MTATIYEQRIKFRLVDTLVVFVQIYTDPVVEGTRDQLTNGGDDEWSQTDEPDPADREVEGWLGEDESANGQKTTIQVRVMPGSG